MSLVERKAYILPLDIVALEEVTVSWSLIGQFLPILDSHWLILEQSTTNLRYHIQAYATDGSLLDLPMHMLDPRRPAPSTPEGAGNSSLHPRTSKTS